MLKLPKILLALVALNCACSHQSLKPEASAHKVVVDKPEIKNLEEISPEFRKLQHSLVRLNVKSKGESSYATGFFYQSNELLVTSHHLFDENHECLKKQVCELEIGLVKSAKTLESQKIKVEVALQAPQQDLIFLKVPSSEFLSQVQPLQKRASEKSGDLLAVGFYQDQPALTFSKGKMRQEKDTSIVVSAGFSGSPVINQKGELVGVVSAFRPLQNQQIGLAQLTDLF